MKKYISVIIIIVLVLFSTCEEDLLLLNVDCEECYSPEPDSADLVVHLSFDAGVSEIPLVFYVGKADKKNVEYIDTAYSTPYYLYVETEKPYSVEAKYELSDKTIIAVDGTEIKNRKVTDVCSETCYVLKNQDLYVELKDY